MPGFDQTGPTGMGPKTGRGFGFCNMFAAGLLGGFRKRFAKQRGLSRFFGLSGNMTKKDQLEKTAEYKQALKEELEDVIKEEEELKKAE